jgi:hypothetical protein
VEGVTTLRLCIEVSESVLHIGISGNKVLGKVPFLMSMEDHINIMKVWRRNVSW